MPSITIRDIPAETLAAIREQARQERRSLNAELLYQLEQIAQERQRLQQFRASASQRRRELTEHARRVGDAGLTIDMIDEIIDEASHGDNGF